jgi:hypothetical protein
MFSSVSGGQTRFADHDLPPSVIRLQATTVQQLYAVNAFHVKIVLLPHTKPCHIQTSIYAGGQALVNQRWTALRPYSSSHEDNGHDRAFAMQSFG